MSDGSNKNHQSVARGAVTVVAMRWTDRLIGVISTLILARLLMPDDFGIIAMASLVVVLLDTLFDLGVNSALVQKRDASREDFDTAWTMRLIQNAIAAALIAGIVAPLAAGYFGDHRVTDVLRVMAISLVLSGFENIGIVAFQKNMEFGREFHFIFLRRIVGFAITIALALWLRSYWAMVIGTLASRIAGVWLSYALHEYRPRFSLARIWSLWSFSQWILVRNLGGYGVQHIDKILLGRRAGASSLGAYTLADEIAAMPTGELLAPIGRVLFPAFVRVANDPVEFRRIFLLALGVQALVALPSGIGLALVAPLAVPLLLGQNWLVAVPIVQVLALVNVALVFSNSGGYLLLTLGRVRTLAVVSWIQLLLIASLALMLFPDTGAEGIAGIRLGAGLFAAFLVLVLVLKAAPMLRPSDLLSSIWRPLTASGVFGLLLAFYFPTSWFSSIGAALVAEVALGGIVYLVVLLLLWRLTGCAEGAEVYLLEKLGLKTRVLSLLCYSWKQSRH